MAFAVIARFRFLDGGVVNLYRNNELRCSCSSTTPYSSTTNGSKPCLHILLYEKIRDGEFQGEGFKWVETSSVDGVRHFVWRPELKQLPPADVAPERERFVNTSELTSWDGRVYPVYRREPNPPVQPVNPLSYESLENAYRKAKEQSPKFSGGDRIAIPFIYEPDDIIKKPKPSLPSSMPDPKKPKRKIRKE